uniref:Cyclic nucleotide-binding domain-containing protein n=1 Tax=Aureoumbra lagunensis TaxID=44058 RepID=A0A6S8DZX4_9STRA
MFCGCLLFQVGLSFSLQTAEWKKRPFVVKCKLTSVRTTDGNAMLEGDSIYEKEENKKKLIRALTSLDQGDFRWELITRTKGRRLKLWEKAVLSGLFIGIAIAVQEILSPRQTIAEHLAYLATFFAFSIGEPIGYRSIAIATSAIDVASNDINNGFVAVDDAIPDVYNVIFILVNSYYVMRYTLNKINAIRSILDPIEEELYSRCFEPLGVGAYQYLKLLDRAEWFQTKSNRTALTIQGEPVDALYVSITGSFDVSSNGLTIASIGPFQIIGEAATLENLQSKDGTFHQSARATVTAEKDSVYIKWSHTCLFELQQTDEEFAKVIRLAIARTLSHKLKSARRTTTKLVSTTTPQNEYMPTSDVKLLQPLLAPDEERLYLACLAKNGWDDIQIAADFLRLANKQTSNSILIGNGDQFIALAQGNARVYDEQGVQVLKIQAPSLVGAERFLENLIIFNGKSSGIRSSTATDNTLTSCAHLVELEPRATAFIWNLNLLTDAIRNQPKLKTALNRLYLSTWTTATKKAQTLFLSSPDEIEDEVDSSPSFSESSSGGDDITL